MSNASNVSNKRRREWTSMGDPPNRLPLSPAQSRAPVLLDEDDDQETTTRPSASLRSVPPDTFLSHVAMGNRMTSYDSSQNPFGPGPVYGQAASAAQPLRNVGRGRISINDLLLDMRKNGGNGGDDGVGNGESLETSIVESGGSLRVPQLQPGNSVTLSNMTMSGTSNSDRERAQFRTFTPQGFTPINATRSGEWTPNQSYNSSTIPNPYSDLNHPSYFKRLDKLLASHSTKPCSFIGLSSFNIVT